MAKAKERQHTIAEGRVAGKIRTIPEGRIGSAAAPTLLTSGARRATGEYKVQPVLIALNQDHPCTSECQHTFTEWLGAGNCGKCDTWFRPVTHGVGKCTSCHVWLCADCRTSHHNTVSRRTETEARKQALMQSEWQKAENWAREVKQVAASADQLDRHAPSSNEKAVRDLPHLLASVASTTRIIHHRNKDVK